jgi:hypothetical protein
MTKQSSSRHVLPRASVELTAAHTQLQLLLPTDSCSCPLQAQTSQSADDAPAHGHQVHFIWAVRQSERPDRPPEPCQLCVLADACTQRAVYQHARQAGRSDSMESIQMLRCTGSPQLT